MTDVKNWRSPNFGDRKGQNISMVVLHYTGMQSADEALERLCDREGQVSAHYLVNEDGALHSLVDEDQRAWHAGVSEWGPSKDINSVSIGIEIVNPGHEFGYRPFPDVQIGRVVTLVREISKRHSIHRTRIVGHSDVAPGRKEDPGELFPWARLSGEGLAIGPWPEGADNPPLQAEHAGPALIRIGYGVEAYGLDACVEAFQRRFCPQALKTGLTDETLSAIAWTHDQFKTASADPSDPKKRP